MPFYHLPNPWNPHYAIPEYVLAEPPGRGTFTTRWLPRRTISSLSPDFIAKPDVGKELLDRPDAGLEGMGADPYIMLPGGRLETSNGKLYETLGGLIEDHQGKLMLGGAALAAWYFLLRKKGRRNPARRRPRRRRR